MKYKRFYDSLQTAKDVSFPDIVLALIFLSVIIALIMPVFAIFVSAIIVLSIYVLSHHLYQQIKSKIYK
jgi:type III secretory pathway component EscV